MGKCNKFENKDVKKLHDIGTRVVMETDFSLHENVEGFQEDLLFAASHVYHCKTNLVHVCQRMST